MDSYIHRRYETYRRGLLRVCSAVSSPIMLLLHLTPMTRGFSSSLAEIGLLASFLLWVASQYNVWGRVCIIYDSSLDWSLDLTKSEYISSKYQRMTVCEESSERSNNAFNVVESSSALQQWEDKLSMMDKNYCRHMRQREI